MDQEIPLTCEQNTQPSADALSPEVASVPMQHDTVPMQDDTMAAELLLPSEIPMSENIPAKMFICARGFTEAEWNNAYAAWVTATSYDEDEDEEFDPDVDCPKEKARSLVVNGVMGEVDELDLFDVEPEEIPGHINKLFAKFNPGGKRKRRDLTFRQKLALLKWMDYAYPRGNYNYSDIARKTLLDRKTIRQMVGDRDIIQKKVDDMKHSGSTKKSGGFASKKRVRLSVPQFPALDDALNKFLMKSLTTIDLSRK